VWITACTPHSGFRRLSSLRFQEAIYVLLAFQKKSTSGIATPKRERDFIRQRLAEAERNYREEQN